MKPTRRFRMPPPIRCAMTRWSDVTMRHWRCAPVELRFARNDDPPKAAVWIPLRGRGHPGYEILIPLKRLVEEGRRQLRIRAREERALRRRARRRR